MATINDFLSLDLRVGKIIKVEFSATAKIPAYKLEIDFGELGVKKSSAQITHRYNEQTLLGRNIVAVTNIPPKKVAGFSSECLVLGAVDVASYGDVILLDPGQDTPAGTKIL